MHGPASFEGGSFKAPVWPLFPKIPVLDTVVLKLGPVRRALWRKYRTNALDKWAQAGLELRVKEALPRGYPKITDMEAVGGEESLCALMVPGTLRLMSMPGLLGGTIEAFADWRCEGGVAAFKLGLKFWSVSIFRRNYLLTHEIGHTLGLNHRPQDEANKSVMNGRVGAWANPDAHDLDSLRNYYFA